MFQSLPSSPAVIVVKDRSSMKFSVFMNLANAWHRHLSQHTPKIPHPPIQNIIYKPYSIKKINIIISKVVINVFAIY